MGGLGPGYEQAIQILMIELCRESLNMPTKPDEKRELYWERFKIMRDKVIAKQDDSLGGLSGAQAGAALSIAFRFVWDGPEKALEDFKKNNADGADRLIMIDSFFPKPAKV